MLAYSLRKADFISVRSKVSMTIKKPLFFKPSNAEKAFVYQQTQDLVSAVNALCPVAVLLEKYSDKAEKESGYAVTFVLGDSQMNVLARSEGKDLLEVCISAKNQMKKKLYTMAQSMAESPERTKFIDELKRSPYLH